MTGYAASPFWLIAKDDAGGVSILTTTLARGERTLPVFSFEEEAGRFLLEAPGSGWWARRISAPQLGSVLRDSGTSPDLIALDPPPEADAGGLRYLASMYRETFLRLYLREEAAPDSDPLSSRPRPSGKRGGLEEGKGKPGPAKTPPSQPADDRQPGWVCPTAPTTIARKAESGRAPGDRRPVPSIRFGRG